MALTRTEIINNLLAVMAANQNELDSLTAKTALAEEIADSIINGAPSPVETPYISGSEQWFSGEAVPRATGAVTLTGGRLYYIPIKLEAPAEIASLYPRGVGSLVGNFVLGVYEITADGEGPLLFQTGEGDANLNAQTLTITNYTLPKGVYILAWHSDVDYSIGAREGGVFWFGSNLVNTQYRYAYITLTYNSTLPATMSTGLTYVTSGNTPRIGFNIV